MKVKAIKECSTKMGLIKIPQVTIGKIYDVIECDRLLGYRIIDDQFDNFYFYDKDCFIELRDKNLTDLGI